MNKNWNAFWMIILLFVISGCSELLPKNGISVAVPKNSLIVLDQMNQAVRVLEMGVNTNILLDVLPTTTANDVKIKGNYAYIVLSSPPGKPSEGNKLIRYDLQNGGSLVTGFPSGSNPFNQVIDGNQIYITLSTSNQVAIIDADSSRIIQNVTLTPQGEPYGIAVDSNNVYIATSDGWLTGYANSRITVLSKTNYLQVTNIACVNNPTSLTVFNGKLYIAGPSGYDGTGKVQIMNLNTYTVSDVSGIPHCSPISIKSFSNKLYIIDGPWGGNGGIYIYDPVTLSLNYILSNVYLYGLQGLDFDGNYLYTSESIYGTKTYKVNLASFAVDTINGIGGGDCVLYQ